MTERARKLRERVRDVLDQMCPAADPPFAPEEAVHVLRAVVEELGVTEEIVGTLRTWAESGMIDRGVGEPEWGDCDKGCDALSTLLEAVEDE